MPRIQEYLPENEAQGPVGQTSPMLEQVTMFGRGIEEAGRDITDAGNIIHQRQTQAETSDAYASVAEQRANMMMRIQQETADGTLNMAKVKEEYANWVGKQYDTYNTTGGKDAFTRASSRAGGSILQTAGRGQAIVAGNRAKENLNSLSNVNSNLVEKDPSQFADLHDAQVEAVQAQVDAGALTQPQAEQIKKAMNIELSKGAVRGYMQSDYENIKNAVIASGDKVDPNKPQLNTALSALKHGAFDEFLDSDHKAALERELRGNQAAAQVAGKQALAQRQTAIDAKGEAFKVGSYEKLLNNSLNAEDVTKAARSGIITPDEQLKMYHLIDQAGKEESKTAPALKNALMARVLSPDNDPQHISDPMQIAYMVGNGITHKDFQDITQAVKMVPSNRVNSFREAELYKVAEQRIGAHGPDGQYNLMIFQNNVQQAKAAALKAGEPIGPLFDPASPKFLGNTIPGFVKTPSEILRQQADAARGKAVAPTTVATQPGVIPTPSKPSPRAAEWSRDWAEAKGAVSEAWNAAFPTSSKDNSIDFASRYNAKPAATNAAKPEEIATMGLDDLKKLNPKNLSPAQKAVAAARWNALKGKK